MTTMRKGRKRYLINEDQLPPLDLAAELHRHASILVKRFPPTVGTFNVKEDASGFYSGPTSIAFQLFSLRQVLPSSIAGRPLLEWAKLYLDIGPKLLEKLPKYHQYRSISPRWCGITCESLCWAVTSAAVYSDDSHLAPVFECAGKIAEADAEDAFDEHAVGRAGYLYLLRLAKVTCPSVTSKVDEISHAVIEKLLRHTPDSRAPWKFRERYYMGLSHGWSGSLVQILLTDPSPARAQQLRPMLADLIRQQLPNGNWRVYADKKSLLQDDYADQLVQMSHGAAGMVVCLLAIRSVYQQDADFVSMLDDAVQKAQECIWSRGLLTKESCLLHGAAGNSLALLDRDRKMSFLAASSQERVDQGNADGSHEPSNSSSGIHRGLAGRLWAMSEGLKGRSGVFITFNDV